MTPERAHREKIYRLQSPLTTHCVRVSELRRVRQRGFKAMVKFYFILLTHTRSLISVASPAARARL